ncbi:oxidoreductase, short chain [Trichuris trichiura]|uniref:Oxidoreductase, short chain n=1 Tax=Trichuris trichiura TaxID=36087 RepID=A0A077YWJ9_TRITR|nr:oxidoreductase, short chain [Trichuris trichiura]
MKSFVYILLSLIAFTAAIDVRRLEDKHFIGQRFAGKTVLITGAARGIGKAAAIRLAYEGANLILVDWFRNETIKTYGEVKKIQDIVPSNSSVRAFIVDVSSTKAQKRLARKVNEYFPDGIDGAVNAAGVMDAIPTEMSLEDIDVNRDEKLVMAPIHQASDEYWEKVMAINIGGMFKSLRVELQIMMKHEKGGSIVNIGSVAGLLGVAGMPAYVASKHAVIGLTKNAALDYAQYGIRVNSLNMDTVLTGLVTRTNGLYKKMIEAGLREPNKHLKTMSILQAADSNKRVSTVWEQASYILFLLSDEASHVTGASATSDGGFTAF